MQRVLPLKVGKKTLTHRCLCAKATDKSCACMCERLANATVPCVRVPDTPDCHRIELVPTGYSGGRAGLGEPPSLPTCHTCGLLHLWKLVLLHPSQCSSGLESHYGTCLTSIGAMLFMKLSMAITSCMLWLSLNQCLGKANSRMDLLQGYCDSGDDNRGKQKEAMAKDRSSKADKANLSHSGQYSMQHASLSQLSGASPASLCHELGVAGSSPIVGGQHSCPSEGEALQIARGEASTSG
jgi:hypothetical protein